MKFSGRHIRQADRVASIGRKTTYFPPNCPLFGSSGMLHHDDRHVCPENGVRSAA